MNKAKQPRKISLGIDFGTTRTVVARVESGNYPLVTFETERGDAQEWYPSLIAGKDSQRVFGWEAWEKQPDENWQKVRSLKRYLSLASPQTCLQVGGEEVPILSLLVEYLSALRHDLLEHANLRLRGSATLEAMIGVPANANNNQRFLTLEAFQRAGFEVIGMLNEPAAAGVEYAFRFRQGGAERKREFLIVYDLGGGTFDLSVIQMSELSQRVMTTAGIERLGGDDFDALLAELVLERAGLDRQLQSNFWLLEECREKKENINPYTKKIYIDLNRVLREEMEITIPVVDFEERCLPLVEQTIGAIDQVMALSSHEEIRPGWSQSANLYLVGGAAELPLIARRLKERYGRHIRKSPYPRGATAIGLAIAADALAGYSLEDRFSRHFGVWREAEEGRRISFDPIFAKDTPLPAKGEAPIVRVRRYQPVHNIGHFRYIECSYLDEQGQPAGDISTWSQIHFPLDPALSGEEKLEGMPIHPMLNREGIQVEEIYTCDHQGIIKVTLVNLRTGLRKSYQLRHGPSPIPSRPEGRR